MKASELKDMIRQVVAEELKKQLPIVLSEMYVKRIVAEQTLTNGGDDDTRRSATPSSLLERLSPSTHDRAAVREKIRRSVLESPDNPMADLYAGVNVTEDVAPALGGEGIPLEALPGMFGTNMARAAGIGQGPSTRGPVPETPEMKMRRLEESRRKLDSVKVG